MRSIRRIAVGVALLGSVVTTGTANAAAATATTSVVVNFPEILVLYTFSDLTLNLEADFLSGEMGLGVVSACNSGFCADVGTATVPVDALTEDLDIASDENVPTASGLTDVTLTLENAFAARSLGMTDANYTLGVNDGGFTSVLGVGATQATSFANLGLQLATGDLEITIDVSEIDTPAEGVSVTEDFEITVSGT